MTSPSPEDLLVETALKLLEEGPMHVAVLTEKLAALGRLGFLTDELDDDEELADAVLDELLVTDDLWTTADDICALTAPLVDGLVLTHRLTEEEVATGELATTPDLEILDWDAFDKLELAGGGRLVEIFEPESGVSDLLLAGPPGWLDGLQAGDLVAFTRRGFAVDVARVDEPADDRAELAALREVVDLRIPPGMGEEVSPLVLDALVMDASLFRRPTRPLAELLPELGLERRGDFFGRRWEDWETYGERSRMDSEADLAEDWGFNDCCMLAFERVGEAFTSFSSGGPAELADLAAVARDLGHGNVAPALADQTLDSDAGGDDDLLAFASHILAEEKRRGAPACLLLALDAERRGDAVAAEARLRAALEIDPAYGPAAAELVQYEVDRSNLARAVTLLRHPDLDPDSHLLAELEDLRRHLDAPYRGVSRNDPCPCGSGRKFKVCCQRLDHAPLSRRTRLLLYKLAQFATRPHRRARILGLASSACDPDDPDLLEALVAMVREPFITDLAAFEGGAAEEYLDERGPLLPNDERELLGRLVAEPRRLWEVTGVERGSRLTLRDTRTGEAMVVAEPSALPDLETGEYVLARAARLDDEVQLVSYVLRVPLRLRPSVMEVIDAGLDADGWAEWYGGATAGPEVTNREGEPLVMCRVEVATEWSLDHLHAVLDPLVRRDDEGEWTELIDIDGEPIVRGHLRAEEGQLVIEANSVERAERFIDIVMDVVPDAEVVLDERFDAREAVRRYQGASGAAPVLQGTTPELQAAVDEFIRQKERAWLDESIPALGGLTPRQALDDPSRREDLLALLRELDVMPRMAGEGGGFDAGRLRSLLGLDAGAV